MVCFEYNIFTTSNRTGALKLQRSFSSDKLSIACAKMTQMFLLATLLISRKDAD